MYNRVTCAINIAVNMCWCPCVVVADRGGRGEQIFTIFFKVAEWREVCFDSGVEAGSTGDNVSTHESHCLK